MLKDDLRPNVATFNTILIALTEGGQLIRALKVMKMMKENSSYVNPNRTTYSIIINALVANKRPEDAETILDIMYRRGLKPDVDLFTATVTAYEKNNQPGRALRLMEKMSEIGYNFYEIKVLDNIFKRVVKLVNTLSPNTIDKDQYDDDVDEWRMINDR